MGKLHPPPNFFVLKAKPMAIKTQGRRAQVKPPTRQQKVQALTNFWVFVDIINFQGGSQRFAQCHKELWDWYWSTHKEPGVNRHLTLMPRGHLKSTIMSVGRVLWRIYQNPNIRIFVGTSKNELSSAFIREAKAYLEDPWLQEHVWNARPHVAGNLIPTMDRLGRSRRKALEEDGEYTEAEDKKIIWRSNALQVNREFILKEPTLMVGSVGSQATGMHFDEAQFDDIITYDNISTEDKRNKLMSWIYDIESIIDPEYEDDWIVEQLVKKAMITRASAELLGRTGGVFNVVGTRYDLSDYYGHIIDNQDELGFKVYQRNIYVNGVDNADGYLWKEKWDEALEKSTRRSMTAMRFASQYLNRVLAAENVSLNWDKIRPLDYNIWSKTDQGQSCWVIPRGTTKKQLVRLVMSVDTASSVSDTSDYTCICIGGKDEQGNFYLFSMSIGRWRSTEILENIYRMADEWNIRQIHVEAIGGFKHFTQFIRDSFDKYRPIGVVEYRPKGEKIMRVLNALEPIINNDQMWFLPTLFGNKIAQDQMMFFPRKTMHDDFPDCLAMCVELAKRPIKQEYKKQFQTNSQWGGLR
jgi:predicted phage terminase large subunit-like protein